jgi:hypothetical protein
VVGNKTTKAYRLVGFVVTTGDLYRMQFAVYPTGRREECVMSVKKIRLQLEHLMENDECSICGKFFPHMSKNYGGVTASGKVELVGECCVDKLKAVYAGSIYLIPPVPRSKTM